MRVDRQTIQKKTQLVHQYLASHQNAPAQEIQNVVKQKFGSGLGLPKIYKLKNGIRVDKTHKTCPKCNLQAITADEVKDLFGFRKIRGSNKVQSWCRGCRKLAAGGKNDTTLPPKIIKMFNELLAVMRNSRVERVIVHTDGTTHLSWVKPESQIVMLDRPN